MNNYYFISIDCPSLVYVMDQMHCNVTINSLGLIYLSMIDFGNNNKQYFKLVDSTEEFSNIYHEEGTFIVSSTIINNTAYNVSKTINGINQ